MNCSHTLTKQLSLVHPCFLTVNVKAYLDSALSLRSPPSLQYTAFVPRALSRVPSFSQAKPQLAVFEFLHKSFVPNTQHVALIGLSVCDSFRSRSHTARGPNPQPPGPNQEHLQDSVISYSN